MRPRCGRACRGRMPVGNGRIRIDDRSRRCKGLNDVLVLLVVVGGIAAGGSWVAFVSHQYMKHRLRSFPDVNAFRRKKAVLRAIIGICIILIVTMLWVSLYIS